MKWRFFVALLLFSWALLSAWGDVSSYYIGQPSPNSEASWTKLDDLLTQLELEALSLSDSSETLDRLLKESRSELTRLSSRLAESETLAGELSSSLELSARSLSTSVDSLSLALRQGRLELWIWRGGFIIASGLVVYMGVR